VNRSDAPCRGFELCVMRHCVPSPRAAARSMCSTTTNAGDELSLNTMTVISQRIPDISASGRLRRNMIRTSAQVAFSQRLRWTESKREVIPTATDFEAMSLESMFLPSCLVPLETKAGPSSNYLAAVGPQRTASRRH
jgi:hypothetical protein